MGGESQSLLERISIKKKKTKKHKNQLVTHSAHSQQTAQEKNPRLRLQEKHGCKEKWMQV